MSFDDDLRRTLRTEAARYDPDDDGRGRISSGVRARRNRRRRIQGGVLGAVAVAIVAVGAGIALVDDPTEVDAGPVASETPATSSPPPETTTPPTTAVPVAAVFPGIWPFASQEAVDGYADGDARFEDPVFTAVAFARDYLGMLDPVVGEPAPTAEGAVAVELRPRGEDGQPVPDGGASTTVALLPYESSYGATVWTVAGARSPNIVIEEPTRAERVASPLAVRGEATGYEGTVVAEVRQDGMRAGDSLGHTVGIAGSMGEMGPLALDVAFRTPSAATGALVVSTDTGRDGVGVPEATVVRLSFQEVSAKGPPPPAPAPGAGGPCSPVGIEGEPAADEMDVMFYLTCDSAFTDDPTAEAAFVPTFRRVPRTAGVLQATLEQLVAGPSAEERAAGLSSLFSAETAGILAGVTIIDGTAVVDLAEPVDNASTSAGGRAFRGALDRTVLQFPTVDAVEYRLAGSCDAFWRWQQVGDCRLVTRDDL